MGPIKTLKITKLVDFPPVFTYVKTIGFFLEQGKFKCVDISYKDSRPQIIESIKSYIDSLVPNA